MPLHQHLPHHHFCQQHQCGLQGHDNRHQKQLERQHSITKGIYDIGQKDNKLVDADTLDSQSCIGADQRAPGGGGGQMEDDINGSFLEEAYLIHKVPMIDMHFAESGHIINELTRPVCVAQQHHSSVQLCISHSFDGYICKFALID